MKKYVFVLFVALATLLGGCNAPQPAGNGKVMLNLAILFEGQPLVLADKQYRSANGDVFTIERFQFYMSNVKFKNTVTRDSFAVPNSYHLVVRKDNTHLFELPFEVPAGKYDLLEFAVGVDPARNLSTDQVGDLDPSNNMAWDWNTGYKFLLLEGRLFPPSGNQRGLVLHVGTDENYRVIRLPLSTTLNTERPQNNIAINVEVSGIFNSPHVIDLSRQSTVMMGPVANRIADNYGSSVFSISSVTP